MSTTGTCRLCAREAVALGYRMRQGPSGPATAAEWVPMCSRCCAEVAFRVKALPATEQQYAAEQRAAKRERRAVLAAAVLPDSESWGYEGGTAPRGARFGHEHETAPTAGVWAPSPPAQVHSETSVEAADAIASAASTLRERVYDWLAGQNGATDEEMQEALGMNPSTQRPRRVELVEQGRVKDSGMRHKTRSGRNAVVWVVTQHDSTA